MFACEHFLRWRLYTLRSNLFLASVRRAHIHRVMHRRQVEESEKKEVEQPAKAEKLRELIALTGFCL